jgi:calcium-dependent protein kinase
VRARTRPRRPPAPARRPRSDATERLAEAKRMLREADANGDGKISRAEFSGLLRENVMPDSLSLYDNRLRFSGVAAPSA